jgi:hypothetical protein
MIKDDGITKYLVSYRKLYQGLIAQSFIKKGGYNMDDGMVVLVRDNINLN